VKIYPRDQDIIVYFRKIILTCLKDVNAPARNDYLEWDHAVLWLLRIYRLSSSNV